MDATQVAQEAVRRAFKNKDILDDAMHGTEFSSLDADHWRELVAEVLVEAGNPEVLDSEKLILSECRRLYRVQRQKIKNRVKQLKAEIGREVAA